MELQELDVHLAATLEKQQAVAQANEENAARLAALAALVSSLPERTTRQVCVPLTSVAFFEGRLVHLNDFLVRLGAEPRTTSDENALFVEHSASQTVALLRTREADVRAAGEAQRAALKTLEEHRRALGSVAADSAGFLEIREPYEEGGFPAAVAVQPTSSHRGAVESDDDDDTLLERLDKLELQEAAAEENNQAALLSPRPGPPVPPPPPRAVPSNSVVGDVKERDPCALAPPQPPSAPGTASGRPASRFLAGRTR